MKTFAIFWVWLAFACMVFMAKVGGLVTWPWWLVLAPLALWVLAVAVVVGLLWLAGRGHR